MGLVFFIWDLKTPCIKIWVQITFTQKLPIWKFFVCLSAHSNSQKSVYYYLVITLWKCEYCLMWVLNKSILFVSNSLKVSVLCDMNYEKRFCYSLILKELFDNVSITWYRLKCVVLLAIKSLKMSALFDNDMKSGKCQ